jgi:hypothetical protein
MGLYDVQPCANNWQRNPGIYGMQPGETLLLLSELHTPENARCYRGRWYVIPLQLVTASVPAM